jgi:hypothetical protein
MEMKKIAFALLGLGALLVVFGCIMWAVNKPNFMAGFPQQQMMSDPDDDARWKRELMVGVQRAAQAYNRCLFSSSYAICQSVTAVPFLNIGGILVFLSGAGLFVFGRRSQTQAQ